MDADLDAAMTALDAAVAEALATNGPAPETLLIAFEEVAMLLGWDGFALGRVRAVQKSFPETLQHGESAS
jgi:hypothetical protein